MNRRAWACVAVLICLRPGLAQEQPSDLLPRVTPRESLMVPEADRTRLEAAFRACVVRVESDTGTLLGMGCAFDSQGYFVAKAGDLLETSNLVVRAYGGRHAIARRVGYDPANDILLLKANLGGFHPPPVAPEEPGLATFVYAAEAERKLSLRGGVISAAARAVDKREGYMGIRMADRRSNEGGVRIFDVLPQSGAFEAGLKAGDVLTTVEGEKVVSQEDVRAIVFKHDPGEVIRVRIRRDGEEQEKEVRLKHASTLGGELFDRNQLMSGETSRRKTGFSRILQHEITLRRAAMGGPLLDGEGRLAGLNIARVNRVEVYALPWSVVVSSVEKLRASHRDEGANP